MKPSILLTAVLVLSALPTGIAEAQSVTSGQADWPQFRFSAAHTGFNPFESQLTRSNLPSVEMKWATPASRSYESSYPAVYKGTVYVESSGSDGSALLQAFDASTGELRWTTKVARTSAAVRGRFVYVGGSRSKLFALRRTTGEVAWTARIGPPCDTCGSGHPTVAGDRIYISSGDENLYALDASTGDRLWVASAGVPGGSPTVAGGRVFLGGNFLRAFDAQTGQLQWVRDPGSEWPISSSLAVANGVVYFLLRVSGLEVTLFAVDAATGSAIWNGAIPCCEVSAAPAVANGVVIVGSQDGNVYAFAAQCGTGGATCSPLWVGSVGDEVRGPPAIANGVVYAGNGGGGNVVTFPLRCDSGGALCPPIARLQTGGSEIAATPTVANGMVYVGTDDAGMAAFGLPK